MFVIIMMMSYMLPYLIIYDQGEKLLYKKHGCVGRKFCKEPLRGTKIPFFFTPRRYYM